MPPIDGDRIAAELQTLGAITSGDGPGITRVVYTEQDQRAREWFRGLFREAGLDLREDPAGTMFARWQGSDPSLPAVATGSHIDAIPNSGIYDGTVGVLGGLEAIRALQRAGFKPRRSIELILFTAEEPTRFGLGCLGSRLMSGALDPVRAEEMVGKDGVPLADARMGAGFHGDLSKVRMKKGAYAHFVELHIEQGPILEREGLDIGAVEAIAAPATLRIRLDGSGGHAGAVLMPGRRDALCAAAELTLAVEQAGLGSGSPDTVATTGVLNVFPGAVNSIPSRVQMEIDVRDIDGATRDAVVARIRQAAESIAERRRVTAKIELLNADPPARCSPRIVQAIEEAASAEGLRHRRLISRAYHDSLFMAMIAPTAMIFIPCRDGVSHRPDEYSSPEAITRGAAVLARTLATLSSE